MLVDGALRGDAQPARLAVEERLEAVLGLDVPHEAAVQVELAALAAEVGRGGRGGGQCGRQLRPFGGLVYPNCINNLCN